MTSLFISYSRKDIDAARGLTGEFQGQGLDFWIDWEGIPPTVDWWKEIQKGIEGADIFLFLISPDSCASRVCRQEIEHAVRNGKRLIPVVVRDVKADDAPQELRHLNWIFLRETDDFEAAFRKLITAIQTDYEWVQAHRQLQVKALEWERTGHKPAFLLHGEELQDAEQQLVTNASKEPHPTDLQREYVLKSRQASDRQRRITMAVALGGILALAVLAIAAIVQAGRATTNAQKEQAASTLASNNANTAEANALEAQQQERIARIRELSAQAELNVSASPSRALLLAIEAAQLNRQANLPLSVSVRQALYNALKGIEGDPLPGSQDTVDFIELSRDGKWVFTDSDFNVQVWKLAQPWGPPLMIENANIIQVTPAGRVVLGLDTNLEIWDFSGDEPERLLQFTFDQGYAQSESAFTEYYLDAEGYSSEHYAISEEGRWFVIHKQENTFGMFDLDAPGQKAVEFVSPYRAEQFPQFTFSPNGDWLVIEGMFEGSYLYRIESDNTTGQVNIREQMYLERAVSEFGSIDNFTFSPDGNWLLVASTQAELWDLRGGDVSAQTVLSDTSNYMFFSPDGQYLVEQSESLFRLWRLSEQLFTSSTNSPLEGPALIRGGAIDFSPEGRFALIESQGVVYSWDLTTGVIHGPRDAGSFVYGTHFLSDSSGVVLVTEAGDLIHYSIDLAAQRNLGNFPGLSDFLLTADDRFLVFGHAGNIQVLDPHAQSPETSKRYVTVQPYSSFVVSNDSRWLIAGSDSDLVPRVWDLNDLHSEIEESIVRVFPGGQHPEVTGQSNGQNYAPGFVLSPDGRWLANIGESNGQLFDLSGVIPTPIILNSNMVSLAFSPDSQWLAGHASNTRTIDTWTMHGDRPLPGPSFELPPERWALTQVEFSPDGKWLVTNDGWQVFVLPWAEGELENWQALGAPPPTGFGSGGAGSEEFRPGDNQVMSPDGQWLAFGKNTVGLDENNDSSTGTFLWNLADLSEDPLELQDPYFHTNHMQFSSNGRWLVVVPGSGGVAALWDMQSADPTASFVELTGNRRLVSAVGFSPDHRWLATGHGNDVYLWDLTSEDPARAPRVLQGHTSTIWSLAFSPDGQTLATGSRDQTIRLWDMNATNVTTAAILLEGHTAEVYDIVYANDSTLVSNSLDGTTRFWDLNFEDMLALACREAGRNLTQQEWQLYLGEETFRETCPAWSTVAAAAPEMNGILPTALPSATTLAVEIVTPTLQPPSVSSTPAAPASIQYTVQSGDSLTSIAAKFNVSVDVIVEDNEIDDPNSVIAGQVLVIRVIATATASLTVTP